MGQGLFRRAGLGGEVLGWWRVGGRFVNGRGADLGIFSLACSCNVYSRV